MSPDLQDLGEYAKQIYREKKSDLQKNYPGITINRLMQELESFDTSVRPLSHFLEELDKGTPLEYIRKECFFYKLPFYVDESVHIPRFETEILVETAIKTINSIASSGKECIRIADIGTGCGNILLSILGDLNLPNKIRIDAIACDISKKALEVAEKNYKQLKPRLHGNCSVQFITSDRMFSHSGELDVIVSNPPYIKKGDRMLVHPQVDKNEPHSSLYLEDAEYDDWFCQLFDHVKKILSPKSQGGTLIMEGSEKHLPRLADLAKARGFASVKMVQDYNHLDRFLILH